MTKYCVFLSSTLDQSKVFYDDLVLLAKFIAKQGILVYGGNPCGYMDVLANTVRQHHGETIGVVPTFFKQKRWLDLNLTTCVLVDSMSERKERLYQEADVFIVFPGGLGTYEEMIDYLSWLALKLVNKPIYVLNLYHFYDGFYQQCLTGLKYGFIKQEVFNQINFVTSVHTCIEHLGGKLQ